MGPRGKRRLEGVSPGPWVAPCPPCRSCTARPLHSQAEGTALVFLYGNWPQVSSQGERSAEPRVSPLLSRRSARLELQAPAPCPFARPVTAGVTGLPREIQKLLCVCVCVCEN